MKIQFQNNQYFFNLDFDKMEDIQSGIEISDVPALVVSSVVTKVTATRLKSNNTRREGDVQVTLKNEP